MTVRTCHYCGRQLDERESVLDWDATGDRTFGKKFLCDMHAEVEASSVRMARFVLGVLCLVGVIFSPVKGLEWLGAVV